MSVVYVPNILGKHGKTIREENLEKQHAIPLKTLVEVNVPYIEEHGLRAFVCEHTRDCDGTPLYSLYYSKDFENLECVKSVNPGVYSTMVTKGHSDDSLVVIRLPDEKVEDDG